MKLLLASFFSLFYLSAPLFSQADKKIELRIIKCENCARYKPEINKILKEEKDIVVIYNRIKVYFNPNLSSGDAFILKCKTCDPGLKFMKFPGKLMPQRSTQPFAGKGDDLVFAADLEKIFSDSLAIIDSAGLNLADLLDKTKLEPFDIRVEYVYKSITARRSLLYDRWRQVLFISQKALFGQLPQTAIDTLSVSVYYYDSNAGKKKLSNSFFKPHFLTNEELNDLKEYIRFLKKEFPELSEAGLTDEIAGLLRLKYKNVVRDNISRWLKHTHF